MPRETRLPNALTSGFRTLWASRNPSNLEGRFEKADLKFNQAIVDARTDWKEPPLAFVKLVAEFAFACMVIWTVIVALAVTVSWHHYPQPLMLSFILGSAFAAGTFSVLVAIGTSLAAGGVAVIVGTLLGVTATLLAGLRPAWFTHAGDFRYLGYFSTAFTVAVCLASANAWLAEARSREGAAEGRSLGGWQNLTLVFALCLGWAIAVFWLSQQTGLFGGGLIALLIGLPALLLIWWKLELGAGDGTWGPVVRATVPLLVVLAAAGATPSLLTTINKACSEHTLPGLATTVCLDSNTILNNGAGTGGLAGLCVAAVFIAIDFVVIRRRWTPVLSTGLTLIFWAAILGLRVSFIGPNLRASEYWVTIGGAVAGAIAGHCVTRLAMLRDDGIEFEFGAKRVPQQAPK